MILALSFAATVVCPTGFSPAVTDVMAIEADRAGSRSS